MADQKKYRDILPQGYSLHWYEIQSLLGRGGYGITYLAVDKNLQRNVAIKEYLPIDFAARQTDQTVHPLSGEHGEMFQWGLERFIKEARTLAKFNHPNIVRVLSVFEYNNTAYMVMEYEQGEDLSIVYKRRPGFSEDELLDVFIPVMDGLSLVHREGFIHRDIKPSNIYIREDHSPVLIDFGSARRATGQTRTLTSLVTYGYAPFEQYNEGHEKQGPWTDIYALGASLYVGITNNKPEDALKRGGAILAGTTDPYEPVSLIAKGRYSKNFLLAIDNALRFRAEDRPQDVLEWAQMLLGNTTAPPLPKEFLQPKSAGNNFEATVIMPADYYEKQPPVTGPSKRNTSRLIDSSGRRVTGEPKMAEVPVSAPPPGEAHGLPPEQPAKRRYGALWALLGVIVVTSIAAAIFFLYPPKEAVEPQLKGRVTEQLPPPVAKKEGNAEKIAALLKQAKEDFSAQRFVQPEGANAAYRYLQVLELDRNNKEAAAGLDKIVQHYAGLVRQQLQEEEVLKAEANLQIIESIAPRSATALELRLKLQSAKEQTNVVAQLLRDASKNLAANRLTEPDDDNALDKFRKVLQINPLNQDAKRGLQQIFDYYAKAAEKYVATGNVSRAESVIDKMELVQPGSLEAEQLRKRLDKISDTETQITQLLRKAKSAYQAGRYTQPEDSSALNYYQQVLKIDPNNSRAKYGIEAITTYYKKQFNKAIDEADFEKAENAVNTLDFITPNSATVVAMYKKLEAAKPPPRPEIEIISDVMSQFKASMESLDVKKLKNLSEFKPGREQFIEQFFANYQSFNMNISGFQLIAKEHEATAHVALSRLVNKQGHAVQPGAWGEFDIVVKKNSNNQWRVYW